MRPVTSPAALRVQLALGARFRVFELDTSTRKASEAAAAIGCTIAQIAKSLIFRTTQSGHPVLVIASGAGRVDENQVATLVGEPITLASADFVRDEIGFEVGGVPPIARKTKPIVLIDEALSAVAEIWAAAGTPNAVFRLTFGDLVGLTGGRVAAVSRPAGRLWGQL